MFCSGAEFWLMRKCYYLKKFKQQGRFSAIWEAKFYWAIYRLAIQRELEAEDSDFMR